VHQTVVLRIDERVFTRLACALTIRTITHVELALTRNWFEKEHPLQRPALFLSLAFLSAQISHAEILISEIMYNPQGTDTQTGADPFNKEWVEIYNSGGTAINLTGWRLEDSQDGDATSAFPAGTILPAGQALVITGDATTFDSQYGNGLPRLQVSSFPTLANTPSPTNETVSLRDNTGALRDSVNYDDELGWFGVAGSQGSSLFLRPEGLSIADNDVGSHWAPSSGGVYGGTYNNRNGLGENNASPGIVIAQQQPAFAPSPDAAWSMVVIPDTQNYVKDTAYKGILTQMTTWIRDHRDEYKIQLVMQEGDIVNNNDTDSPTSGNQTGDQQWQNARESFAVLNGHVPYVMTGGNHDFGTTDAQNRNTQFNDYFRASDNPLVDPAQGGILRGTMQAGRLENAYYELTAPDGREMLVFSLEWGPRQQVVNWANQIAALPEYAGHTAVLVTHAYMYHDETRYDWARNLDADPTNNQGGNPYSYPTASDTNDGEDLWQELVKRYEPFEMTFNGHVGGDGLGYLASTGDHGNTVYQMLLNTQFEANGGNGWIRLLEFLNDGTTVRVRTYSPYLDLNRTDAANAFEFQLSPLPPRTADYDGDGDVDGRDFLAWQRSESPNPLSAEDLELWQQNFAAGLSAPKVPEPFTASLLAYFLVSSFLSRGHRRAVDHFVVPRRLASCSSRNVARVSDSYS
jgi:hypothetical protein